MHVLLTRPAASSKVTAEILNAKNIRTSIQPLFSVVENKTAMPGLDSYQALIFTSQHSVSIFTKNNPERSLPVFCVGDHTASTALQQHFKTVYSADGDAMGLIQLIKEKLHPANGPILRLAGYSGADKVVEELQDAGFQIDKSQVYAIQEVEDLSIETKEILANNVLDGVLFFSPKTASRFYGLIAKHDLAASCRDMTAWCISENTAKALEGLSFKKISVAAKPTQKAMIHLICPN